jgi:toxin YoeB
MSDRTIFEPKAWDEYLEWHLTDKRAFKKINDLVKDILRNGHNGIGHPEPLKGSLSGFWSREIDKKNRLVYQINDDDDVEIIKCKGHYGDK